jgi:hypothetical protein
MLQLKASVSEKLEKERKKVKEKREQWEGPAIKVRLSRSPHRDWKTWDKGTRKERKRESKKGRERARERERRRERGRNKEKKMET